MGLLVESELLQGVQLWTDPPDAYDEEHFLNDVSLLLVLAIITLTDQLQYL